MNTVSRTVKGIFGVAFSVFLIGCTTEIEQVQDQELHKVVFHVRWESETKTVLQEDGSVWWSPSDAISLFVGDGENGGYRLTSTNNESAPFTDFVGMVNEKPAGATYTAIYPYSAENYVDGNIIHAFIPSYQTAKEGTFEKDMFISVARSNSDSLYFRNICSGIKFSVITPGINMITLFSEDFTPLSGSIQYNMDTDTYEQYGDISVVTITSPSESGFEIGKFYYAVISPNTINNGLRIEYHTSDTYARFIDKHQLIFKKGIFKRLYDKDSELEFHKRYDSRAYLGNLVPDGVNKTEITGAYFHAKSEKQTENLLSTDGAPIYYEMEDSEIHYYTSAEIFEPFSADCMFSGWSSLKALDISEIDTFNCPSFISMFDGCISLETLDLSNMSTNSATTMNSMFGGCISLKSIDISNFNTANVTDMFNMFGYSINGGPSSNQEGLMGCCSLESLDLSMLNTSNVKDMSCMFYNCTSLKELNISGWNTGEVTTMSSMFNNCSSLETVDLSSFDTKNTENISAMFSGCSKLKSIDLSNFNTSNIWGFTNLFYGCSSLRNIDLSNFSFASANDGLYSLFTLCHNLKQLDFGNVDLSQISTLYFSFFETARNSKACAIRCSEQTKEAILNKDSFINPDVVTWVFPDEEIPDLPDVIDPELYYSSDFSMDGKHVLLQQATVGQGVDLIIIGDAYSDRLIQDGTYQNDITETMQAIFSMEPYKSFRELFNVHMVYAVSSNESSRGETALDFRTALVPGNENKVLGYTANIVKNKYLSDVAIVVISHDSSCLADSGADGKTYMYLSYGCDDTPVDFGQATFTIAYVPKFPDSDYFNYVVCHEFGHSFAKLGDEYIIYDEAFPEWQISELEMYKLLGIYRNIDITSDPTTIKWNKFLSDPRYNDTGIGIYEGGYLYSTGVWRPSKRSIMSSDRGCCYNAPSREAIYNRIHKLAYGYDWQFDFDKFVLWDAPNIELDIHNNETQTLSNISSANRKRRHSLMVKKTTRNLNEGYEIVMD